MNQPKMHTHDELFERIKEGMEVVDADGDPVGTVAHVRFGQRPRNNEGVMDFKIRMEPWFLNDSDEPHEIGSALDEMEARLVRAGYVRIDTGFLSGDRFATPDQIQAVIGNRVELNVLSDDLIGL